MRILNLSFGILAGTLLGFSTLGCNKAAVESGNSDTVNASRGRPHQYHVECAGDGQWEKTVIKLRGKSQVVSYQAIGTQAVIEGDIVIASLEVARKNKLKTGVDLQIQGITISGAGFRWPNKTVYYAIDLNFQKPDRVHQAIDYWRTQYLLTFVERTNQQNYILFKSGEGCSSPVGMQGNEQDIILAGDSDRGEAIHEIGHAVGLWHEQSRSDRDQFVTIDFTNILPGRELDFADHTYDGDDQQTYDYCSIMHYPQFAFAVDDKKPTITPKKDLPNGCHLGQRDGLSDGDRAAVKAIYP